MPAYSMCSIHTVHVWAYLCSTFYCTTLRPRLTDEPLMLVLIEGARTHPSIPGCFILGQSGSTTGTGARELASLSLVYFYFHILWNISFVVILCRVRRINILLLVVCSLPRHFGAAKRTKHRFLWSHFCHPSLLLFLVDKAAAIEFIALTVTDFYFQFKLQVRWEEKRKQGERCCSGQLALK